MYSKMNAMKPITVPESNDALGMSRYPLQYFTLQLTDIQAVNIISEEENKRTAETSAVVENAPFSTTFLDGEHPASAGNWSSVSTQPQPYLSFY